MIRATPMLRCLEEYEVALIFTKVHEDERGNHNGGRALESKLLRVGCYWLHMLRDSAEFVNQCDKYQRFSNFT